MNHMTILNMSIQQESSKQVFQKTGKMSSQPFFLFSPTIHQGQQKKNNNTNLQPVYMVPIVFVVFFHRFSMIFSRRAEQRQFCGACPLCFLRGEAKTNVFFLKKNAPYVILPLKN